MSVSSLICLNLGRSLAIRVISSLSPLLFDNHITEYSQLPLLDSENTELATQKYPKNQ